MTDDKVGGKRFMSKLQDSVIGPEGLHKNSATEPFAFIVPSEEELPGREIKEVKKFAPPSVRLEAAQKVTGSSRLQTIGQFVTALTYREAMAMGVGIAGKMSKDGASKDSGLSPEVLTRAIQDWAWTWEMFEEEERPK